MSKKEVCLAGINDAGEYSCLINYFTSHKKEVVVAQCPFKRDFDLCINAFEERNGLDQDKTNAQK